MLLSEGLETNTLYKLILSSDATGDKELGELCW
jgi:hypothetical protein